MRTIADAFHDLTDTAAIMLLLFLGFGMTSGMWFDAIGGDLAFKSFQDSTNTVSRLSFGLIDYTDYMSWGHGKKYDGIGIGNAAWTKIIVFWINGKNIPFTFSNINGFVNKFNIFITRVIFL